MVSCLEWLIVVPGAVALGDFVLDCTVLYFLVVRSGYDGMCNIVVYIAAAVVERVWGGPLCMGNVFLGIGGVISLSRVLVIDLNSVH